MCLSPLSLYSITKDIHYRGIYVPCGKCVECLYKIYQEWITRLECTQQMFDNTFFITFTYDDEHLHRDGVSRSDVEDMLSKLRDFYTEHKTKKVNYKYYIISEYGDDYQRPHYHALFFLPTRDDVYLLDHFRKLFYDIWRRGRVDTKEVIPARVAYVAQFHQRLSNQNVPPGCNLNFRLYSKGLGKVYYKQNLERGVMQKTCRPSYDLRRVPRNWRVQGTYHQQRAQYLEMLYCQKRVKEKTEKDYENFMKRFKKKH